MSVEIKELIIRAVATSESDGSGDTPLRSQPVDDTDAIVQECVRQVMKILKKDKGR